MTISAHSGWFEYEFILAIFSGQFDPTPTRTSKKRRILKKKKKNAYKNQKGLMVFLEGFSDSSSRTTWRNL